MRMRTGVSFLAGHVWVMVLLSSGCGLGSYQSRSDSGLTAAERTYLKRIAASAEYSRLAAKLNSRGLTVAFDPKQIETAFKRDVVGILAPLVPFLRTFDGQEYPGTRVKAYGLPNREKKGWINFHITIYATLRPRNSPVGTGGMRPLVDESYLASVLWDPESRLAGSTWISASQLKAVPKEALARAVGIATKQYPIYARSLLERNQTRWLPAWYISKELFPKSAKKAKSTGPQYSAITENTGHNIVMLRFMVPEKGPDRSVVPCHTVAVDLELGRVLGVHVGSTDFGPIFQ